MSVAFISALRRENNISFSKFAEFEILHALNATTYSTSMLLCITLLSRVCLAAEGVVVNGAVCAGVVGVGLRAQSWRQDSQLPLFGDFGSPDFFFSSLLSPLPLILCNLDVEIREKAKDSKSKSSKLP